MIFLKSLGATGFEGGYHKQLYPRISTNTSVYEKAVGEEVTLWCDPQVNQPSNPSFSNRKIRIIHS